MSAPASPPPASFAGLRRVLRGDLFRLDGRAGRGHFIHQYLFNPGFRYVALFRICRFLRQSMAAKFSLYPLALLWFQRVGRIYGIRVPLSCEIGPGFMIAHWGGIWVNPDVKAGKNLTIAQSITLGRASRGPTAGSPALGDNVYVGPGAVVIGSIVVGDNALISANSVVLQNVPENGVVMGVPARMFSSGGSGNYVTNIV